MEARKKAVRTAYLLNQEFSARLAARGAGSRIAKKTDRVSLPPQTGQFAQADHAASDPVHTVGRHDSIAFATCSGSSTCNQ